MIEVGTSLSWVGRAQEAQDHNDAAITTYRREREMYRQALERDPKNMLAKRATVVALKSIGRQELARGNVAAALDPLRIAVRESAEMLRLEPSNSEWRLASIKAQTGLSDALRFSGAASAAADAYAGAQKSLDVLIASDRKNVDWNVSMQSRLDLLGANLAESRGSNEKAGGLATHGVARLQPIARTNDEENSYILASLSLIAGDVAVRLNRKDDALAAWRRASTMIGGSTDKTSLKLAVRYAADRRLGQSAEAQSIAALLDKRGFRHPIYMHERNR